MASLAPALPTIKYHINIPVSTTTYNLQQAIALVEKALAGFVLESVTGWVSTLGAPGWRINVLFYQPFPVNQAAVEEPVYLAAVAAHWELNGKVTAWIHP